MHSRFASVLAGNHDIGTFGRLRFRMRWAGVVCTVLACGVLVVLGAPVSSANQEHEQTLTGAWNVTITFDDPTLVGVRPQGCSPRTAAWSRRDVT
jgi:hypothetical protein